MQTDSDMDIDHQVSVYATYHTNDMDIEQDNDFDCEVMDQGFCEEDTIGEAMDEGFYQDFDYEAIDQDGFDYNQGSDFNQGFDYEAIDQDGSDYNQGFVQSEIHIEFPEGASIGFTIANGVRYLVLYSNM